MAHDTQHLDLPSELWFKVIAFVLSDSIHSVFCCTTAGADLSWERNAFGTLRLVSKSFNHAAFKVADLALAGKCVKLRGDTIVDGEEDESTDVDKDERTDGLNKLKLIYDRFRMIRHTDSDQNTLSFVSQNSISILSAYFGYVQAIKNFKILFSRLDLVHNLETTVIVPAYLAFIEKIHDLFPTAIENILITLNFIAVPEMVEKLRRVVERDWRFISSGLEIVYRCAQVINQRDKWESPDISTEFRNYLNAIYIVMNASAEFYSSELKDRVPGEYPVISKLPGVGMAIGIIVRNGHHHQALADLVSSWT